MNNAQKIREIILDLLKKENKTSSQMLKDLDLNNSLILDMNRRNSMPSADKLGKIAIYLNCSVDYLLGIELKNNGNEQEEKLLNLFNKLDEDYKKQAISKVFQLVVKMSNEQDEELNSKKAYIAALGGGVVQIGEDLAKYIRENAVVDEYKPNNKF